MTPVRWLTRRSPHPVQRLQVQLIGGLRGHELHRRALHRLGDRLRVAEVVLLPLRVGADVLRRHQPSIVAKQAEPAAEMMGTDTGLHADQAGWHIGEPCLHLATRPLLPQRDGPTPIQADDVERILANIDTDHGDHTVMRLRHGVLLSLGASCQPTAGSGQEHGRTIPLAVIGMQQATESIRHN